MSDFNTNEKAESAVNEINPSLHDGIMKIAVPPSKQLVGGGGSNNCKISGPFQAYIDINDPSSCDSFESTEQTDATVDSLENDGLSHDQFQHNEVVWVKRPLLPWFPGIVINVSSISKEVLKSTGASAPTRNQLEKKHNNEEHFVFLFNRKKLWLWVNRTKMRPFCTENDTLFLEKARLYCTSQYRKDIEKAYKKAKKLAYSDYHDKNNRDFNSLFRHLFHQHQHQQQN